MFHVPVVAKQVPQRVFQVWPVERPNSATPVWASRRNIKGGGGYYITQGMLYVPGRPPSMKG